MKNLLILPSFFCAATAFDQQSNYAVERNGFCLGAVSIADSNDEHRDGIAVTVGLGLNWN